MIIALTTAAAVPLFTGAFLGVLCSPNQMPGPVPSPGFMSVMDVLSPPGHDPPVLCLSNQIEPQAQPPGTSQQKFSQRLNE